MLSLFTRPNLIAIISILFHSVSASTCYYPNGTAVNDSTFQPCKTNTTYSMCCALDNRLNYTVDTCMSNGLCYNPCVEDGTCNGSSGTYWRESCTDPTWNSPYCLRGACTNSSVTGGSASDNVILTQCPTDQKWCCGNKSPSNCCQDVERFALTDLDSSATSSPSPLTTAASQTSTVNTASPIPTDGNTDSSNTEKLKLGLGVGIGIGVPILLGLAYIVWLRQSQSRKHDIVPSRDSSQVETSELDGAEVSELCDPGARFAHELESTRAKSSIASPFELA